MNTMSLRVSFSEERFSLYTNTLLFAKRLFFALQYTKGYYKFVNYRENYFVANGVKSIFVTLKIRD